MDASNSSTFGPNEWVEIVDPASKMTFFANPTTGDCSWDPPTIGSIRPKDPRGEWWELFDEKHKLNYYYNTVTGVTDWKKPVNQTIIPLHVIQNALKKAQEGNVKSTKQIAKPGSVAAKKASPITTGNSPINSAHDDGNNRNPQSQSYSNSPGTLSDKGKRNSVASPQAAYIPKLEKTKGNQSSNDVFGTNPTALGARSTSSKSIFVEEVAGRSAFDKKSDLKRSATLASHHTNSNSKSLTSLEVVDRDASIKSLPKDLKSEIGQFMLDGFAKKFFSTHKKGIFRRKVPVEEMLMHSKDMIAQPLMSLNKTLHKEALKCYKTIQRIMNDRSPPVSSWKPIEGILYLLEMGINKGELRDEIYVQLCKQLTENPNGESIVKGWELMCILSITFPPSKNFEDYLKSFLQNHFDSNSNRQDLFARHCMNKFTRICRTGPRGKVPSPAEIDRAKEAPFNPSAFGETLEDIMKMQATSSNLSVPRILPFLTESVLQLNGQQSEGIFRVPADSEKTTELKLRLEKGDYQLGNITDPNVPASLLKFWLRDLAEPLIPASLYQRCIECGEDVDKALRVLQDLPDINREVVIYVIKFLQIMAQPENQVYTKMSSSNLAMVFAPNFLRCPSDNPQVIFENTKYEQIFLRNLIENSI